MLDELKFLRRKVERLETELRNRNLVLALNQLPTGHPIKAPHPVPDDWIVGVACKYNDLVLSLPAPARHHHVIRVGVLIMGYPRAWCGKSGAQGFYTKDGRYLTRKEAMVVARKNGQLLHPDDTTKELFSEDVW